MEDPTKNFPQKGQLERKTFVVKMETLLAEAEAVLAVEGRDRAKTCLPKIYDDLIALNKRNKEDWKNTWVWNPAGDLTEEEFNTLNLRRKLLSNAIGIMTASGVVRHDLNKI
jgi:hypothetical protein